MSVDNSWYLEYDSEENISQGDIFFNCPIFIPDSTSFDYSESGWFLKPFRTEVYTHGIVVMTQACDLERNPVNNVLAARIDDINKIPVPNPPKGEVASRKSYIKQINAGRKPNLHLIGCHDGNLKMNYQVVNFAEVFSIPYKMLNNFSKQHGPRVRLNTPHREYLSQRFGNFYTRIGLPNNDHINEKELIARCNDDKYEHVEKK